MAYTRFGFVSLFSLLLLSFVSAESATQDGFRITAPDVVCTGSSCLLTAEVCNLEARERSYGISFIVDRLEPATLSTLVQEEYFDQVAVFTNASVYNESADSYDVIPVFDRYASVARSRDVWQTVPSSSMQRNGRNTATADNVAFEANECKPFSVTTKNVIGGTWKYDVNFLDPFINSTHYEIGSLTNNSNTWDVDMNSTSSTVTLSSDEKTFTLGTTNSLSANLVSYFSFDSDGTDAEGINNLTLTNTASTTGLLSSARNFTVSSGIGLKSAASSLPTGTGPVSLSFWIKGAGWGSTHGHSVIQLAEQGSGTNYVLWFYRGESAGTIRLAIGSSSAASTTSDISATISASSWSHFVATRNGTSWHVYRNGALLSSGNFSTARTATNTNRVTLHANSDNSSINDELHTMDEVGIWSTVLTPSDVTALYNAGAGLAYPLASGYNTSNNLFQSTAIAMNEDIPALIPTWYNTENGGSITVNLTCNADNALPSWTGSITNNTETNCPVAGDSLMYQVILTGNSTHSPVMQNLTIVLSSIADETMGREAIASGIAASAASAGTTYEDQQVYERLTNGTQNLGTFDAFLAVGDKRYAFNYDEETSSSFPVFYNITPTLYVWQGYNLTASAITAAVTNLINNTYS